MPLTFCGLAHVPLVEIEILTTDCHSGIALNRCYRQFYLKSMKCIKCGCHCTERMLHRTTPKGQDPDWMCMPCIEKHEPELAKNIKTDDDMKLLNIIEDEVKNWR